MSKNEKDNEKEGEKDGVIGKYFLRYIEEEIKNARDTYEELYANVAHATTSTATTHEIALGLKEKIGDKEEIKGKEFEGIHGLSKPLSESSWIKGEEFLIESTSCCCSFTSEKILLRLFANRSSEHL